MDIRVMGTSPAAMSRPISAPEKSMGQSFAQTFQQRRDEQQKQHLSQRIRAILDEMESSAQTLCNQADLTLYRNYCRQLGEVLQEILQNAYLLRTEKVFNSNGRQRVFATITIIDERLDKLGSELISGNGTRLAFISRVEEIRGLIMDLFS